MSRRWIIQAYTGDAEAAAAQWGVSPIVAQLLVNRGLSPDEPATFFLSPQLKDLHRPELLPGIGTAAPIVADAVRTRKKIVIYGDYDVDGTTGVAILWRLLSAAGADVAFYVPHRIDEGYGVNAEAIDKIVADGADVIVTVDCGITAVEVGEQLAKTNVCFIITDHHTPPPVLPRADAIVHPTVAEGYPNPDLCGAGVAFKLAWAVATELSGGDRAGPELRTVLMELLPLAALGTIADVVPLCGENRIIAKHGLTQLAQTSHPGLRALIESAQLSGGQVTGYDVGFKLAPRINAAGRMGHARLAVELLTRADEERASEIALYLADHNKQRQSTERKIVKEVIERVERLNLASDARRAIVVAGEGWHAGVIGIVAARLMNRFHRPAVVIALGEGGGQGSGRSIRPFDIADALQTCSEHLISCGGHPMAAGLRVAPDKVEAFTEAFVAVANNRLTGADLIEPLHLDVQVPFSDLSLSTTEAILSLGPFGAGNPRPALVTDWVELAGEPRLVGARKDHLQVSFRQNGTNIRAIGFGLGDRLEDLMQHRRCQVAFEPMINDFRGKRSVEARIIDLKFPT